MGYGVASQPGVLTGGFIDSGRRQGYKEELEKVDICQRLVKEGETSSCVCSDQLSFS